MQRTATRMVKALEVKLYEEWLRAPGLFSLEETVGRHQLWSAASSLTGSAGADIDLLLLCGDQ